MLKWLRLQNFQCHSKLQIDFDPSITTIVGSSDSGKSAVVRALFYLVHNSPSGESFIRDGAKGCSVSLKTDDTIVKRRRGKGINCYEVDGKVLEAIGKGSPPDLVSGRLNIDQISFQLQHDAPLWLSEAAGQVAKDLNKIVNLNLIDDVLVNLNKQVRSLSSEESVRTNNLKSAQESVENLAWIEEVEIELESALTIEKKSQETSEQINRLVFLITSVEEATSRLDVLDRIEQTTKKEHVSLVSVMEERQQMERRIQSLQNTIEAISRTNVEASRTKQELQQAESELSEIKVCPLCQKPL